MAKKGSPPPAPDYSPLIQAQTAQAEKQYQLAREQFDWAKEQYAQDRATSDQVISKALAIQDENLANARRDRERYETVFQPMEDSLVAEAKDYASEPRKDFEMGRAQAAVGQQFEAARNNATRQLESYGINPSSTRYAALDLAARTQEAAAKAAAGTQASLQTDATGRQLRADAINIGKGYPAQSQQSYATTTSSGNQAVNAGLSTTASGANTMGTGTQWSALGNSSMSSAGNLTNQQYQNQLASWKAEQEASSGWGSVLGYMAGNASKAAKVFGLPFAEGGEVPPEASPTRGRAIDDVPANLTAGEFVMPKETVEWEGLKSMYALIEKARKQREMAISMQDAGGPNVSQMAQAGTRANMAKGGSVRRGVC